MFATTPHLSPELIVIPAVPPDVAKSYTSDDKATWCEFIRKHVDPLGADLREHLPESMLDPDTGVYREGTPISGSLVTLHWFDLDTRQAFAEVLRHQLSETATDGVQGEYAWRYDNIKVTFRASVQLFWEQASWIALHKGTKHELEFPSRNASATYFSIVDQHLADLVFERTFCQMCADEHAPYHAALKKAYEAKFGKPMDTKQLAGLDRDLAKLTPEYIKICTDFWKLGGYTA